MNIYFKLFLIYLAVINIISVIITVYDKICAVSGRWRVKEKTLFLFSILGGSVGMYLTMLIIRHKTRHIKFMLGIPAIFVIQCLVIFLVWRKING